MDERRIACGLLILGMALGLSSFLWAGEPGATSAEGDVRGARRIAPPNPGVGVAGNTGGATYAIPIAALEGRAGLTPHLALSYSSTGRAPGAFGAGWSLDTGAVERTGRRGGVPAYESSPDDPAAGDEFVLAFNGASGRLWRLADGDYHTEQESFLKIRYHRYRDDPDNQRGGYWVVRDTSGTAYVFGYGFNGQSDTTKSIGYQCLPDGRVRGPLYQRWYLDRVVDARGNTITFEYRNASPSPPARCTGTAEEEAARATPVAYLWQIKYNGYTAAARDWVNPDRFIDSIQPLPDAAARRVVIDYEPRPDERTVYHTGFAVKMDRRAEHIGIWAARNRVRKYQLRYQTSPEPGGSSLLQSVQEIGADDSAALPATQFEYTQSHENPCATEACLWEEEGEGSFVLPARRPSEPAAYWAKTVDRGGKNRSYNMGVRVADLNGDGCPDVIQGWHEKSRDPVRRAWISDCRGGFIPDARYAPPAVFEDETGAREDRQFVLDHGFRLLDMNGDSKPDLVRGFRNEANDGQTWGGCPDGRTCLEAWINRTPDCSPGHPEPSCSSWQRCAPPNDAAPECQGLAWEPNPAYAPPKPLTIFRANPRRNHDAGAQFVDLNGDGLPDLVMGGWNAREGWPGFERAGRQTWINTGDPGQGVWKEAGEGYRLPVPLTAETAYTSLDLGVRFVDLNGDGLPDLVQSLDVGMQVYNYPDYCNAPYGTGTAWRRAWINTGAGWQADDRYAFPFGAFATIQGRIHEERGHCTSASDNPLRTMQNGFLFMDLNGDGLVDIIARKSGHANEAWFNTGHGWRTAERGYRAPVAIAQDIADWVEESRAVQEIDWDADGLSDLAQLYHNERTNETHQRRWRNRSHHPELLKRITSPLGGATTIEYTATTRVPHNPATPRVNPNPALPLIMPVVKTIFNNPGIGPVSETRYEFSEGKYYGDGTKQEFRGFGKVRAVVVGQGAGDPSTETVTTYLQDDWNKGSVEWSGTLDPAASPARLYSVSLSQYACLAPGDPEPRAIDCRAAQPPYRHVLIRQDHFTCDGEATVGDDPLDPCRRTASTFAYDNYGNLIRETHYGLIGADGDLARFPGDEKTVARTFSSRDGFTGLILEEKVYDGLAPDETRLLSQRRWSYDNPHPDPDCFRQSPVPAGCLDGPDDFTRPIRQGVLSGIHAGGVRRAGEAESDPWRSIHHKSDRYGNVIRVIDPRGYATAGGFASADPLINDYLPTRTTNAAGQESRFEYDALLRPRATEDPNGCVSGSQYDGLGRITSHWVCQGDIDRHGPSLQIIYQVSATPGQSYIRTETREKYESPSGYHWRKEVFDGSGRVIQIQQESENPGKAVLVTTRYNRKGLVAATTIPMELNNVGPETPFVDAAAPATQVAYDVLGRAVQWRAPDNTTRKVEFRLGEATEPALEKIIRTDEEGHRIVSHYDAYGQQIKVEEWNDPEPEPYRTTYEYDKLGRLVSVTDHLGHTSRFFFNSLSQKIKMIDPDMGTWLYTYDAAGNISTQTNAKGKVVTYTHDALNRLTQKIYDCPGPDGCPPPITYEYDTAPNGQGRLAAVRDQAGTRAFAYDRKGRVIRTQYEVCRDGDSQTLTFITDPYDPSDRLLEKTYPDGETVRTTYNARGLPLSLQIQNEAEPWSRLVGDIAYNPAGKPTFVRYGNGAQTVYSYYDAAEDGYTFRLKRLWTTTDAGAIQDLTYGYDRVGHVKSIRGRLGDGRGFDVGQDFTYDALDRLTAATWVGDAGGYGALAFRYDPLGNITNKEGRSYAYDHTAHAHAVSSVQDGSDIYRYDYDENGNMTAVARNGVAQQRFSYNRDDRLTVFRDSVSGLVMKYGYDDGGRRVRKIKDPDGPAPEVTLYLDDGRYALPPDGTTVKYLSTFARRDTAPDGTRTTYYFHADALGSTSAMTDAAQNLVEQVIYKPFGEIHRNEPRLAGPAGEPHKFTRHEFDAESRLYYMGARYYGPTLGRFLSADAVAPNHGDPQDLNRFAYARNNPTTLTDPTGEKFSWFNFIVSVAGGALSGGLLAPGELATALLSLTGTAAPAGAGFSAAGAAIGAGMGAVNNVVAQKSPRAGNILGIATSALAGGMGAGPFNVSGWPGAAVSGAAAAADAVHPLLGAGVGFGWARSFGTDPTRELGHGFYVSAGQIGFEHKFAHGLSMAAGLNLHNLTGSFGFYGGWGPHAGLTAQAGVSGFVDPRSGFFGPFLSASVSGTVARKGNRFAVGPAISQLGFGVEHGLRSASHLGHHLNYFAELGESGRAANGAGYNAWVSANVIYSEVLRPRDPNSFGQGLFNPARPLDAKESYRWVGAPVLWRHTP